MTNYQVRPNFIELVLYDGNRAPVSLDVYKGCKVEEYRVEGIPSVGGRSREGGVGR